MVSPETAGARLKQRPFLPSSLRERYHQEVDQIRARLAEYASVPRSEWFYECCFCLLTPQSSAVHADAVVKSLKAMDYQRVGGSVVNLLRTPELYIRFHNVKASRLARLRETWPDVESVLSRPFPSVFDRRDAMVDAVDGYGMKEAGHLLRNIGHRGLAIIDRHLLTNLVSCGVYTEIPAIGTRARYRSVESEYLRFRGEIGIDPDEVDLLFWSEQTGHIFK